MSHAHKLEKMTPTPKTPQNTPKYPQTPRPDASVFDFGKKISGPCDDNICTAYAANVRAGMHPVAAFEGWE